jgi:hypothetical protein
MRPQLGYNTGKGIRLRIKQGLDGCIDYFTGSKMILTQEEMKLLKQLKAAGERGRTISALNTPSVLRRLVKAGYVSDHEADLDLVRYRITKRGEYALSDAERFL